MATWEKYKEDFILLTEAGFIAVNQQDENSAIRLFNAAIMLNPKEPLPLIGKGYIHFLKLEIPQAIAVFELVLKQHPNNEMAKAYLGLATSFAPGQADKGEKILEEVMKKSHNEPLKKMADSACSFVEKFVKKPVSPAALQAPAKKKKSR